MNMNKTDFLKASIGFFENYSFGQVERNKNYFEFFGIGIKPDGNLKQLSKLKKTLFANLVVDIKNNSNGVEYDPEGICVSGKGLFGVCGNVEEVNNYIRALISLECKINQAEKASLSIREFALKHKTHSPQTKNVRATNHYFQVKRSISSEVEPLTIWHNKSNGNLGFDQVIIVENQYIFEQNKDEYVHYFSQYDFEYSGQLIVFGSGSKSMSKLLKEWLVLFDTIYCFYDLDKKGYEMWKNLEDNVNSSVRLMMPTKDFIIITQKEIKKNYELETDEKKERYKKVDKNSPLFELVSSECEGVVPLPLYVMYEESFVSF